MRKEKDILRGVVRMAAYMSEETAWYAWGKVSISWTKWMGSELIEENWRSVRWGDSPGNGIGKWKWVGGGDPYSLTIPLCYNS